MALSTGWKIGIGAAVVLGVFALLSLSSKSASASTGATQPPRPPGPKKDVTLNEHGVIGLADGDLGVLTVIGSISKTTNTFWAEKLVEISAPAGGKIVSILSSNENVVKSRVGEDMEWSGMQLKVWDQGTTVLTCNWRDVNGQMHQSLITVEAKLG